MYKNNFSNLTTPFINFFTGKDDYLLKNDISLTEFLLFLWAATRAIWYLIFGVISINFSHILPDTVWISFFIVVALAHIIGIYTNNVNLRVAALFGYSLAWGTLSLLILFQTPYSPLPPGFLLLSLASVTVSTRVLYRFYNR